MNEIVRNLPDGLALRFACPLDTRFPELWPEQSNLHTQIPKELYPQLQLNPHMHWQHPLEQTEAWEQRMFRIAYSSELPALWVTHPLYQYPQVYWPSTEMQMILQKLELGLLNWSELSETELQILISAHILILDPALYQQEMQNLMPQWSAFLYHYYYLKIPQFINPHQMAELRKYARQRLDYGPVSYSLDQYADRYYVINDPAISFWHQHLLHLFNQFFPIQIKATYNMISYYESGSALKYHTDREPCIWNVTIPLDSQPESYQTSYWPLWLKTEQGDKAMNLDPGDVLIYPGRVMPHWREPLEIGRQETVVLFHFVDLDYDGELL